MDAHSAQGTQFYWVLTAAFALFTACALYRFLMSLRRDRFVADTPLVRIRSAAQGYVRIEGRAGPPPDDSGRAPLSGRPCVWWDYQISRRERDSRGNSQWCTVERGTSVAPFTLADADAQCLIGPVGADVTPTTRDVWYGVAPRPSGPPAQGLGIFSTEHDYRYTERLIAPGTHLSVLGELRSHSEVTQVDEQVRTLLATWKKDQASLLRRFDHNHDGELDAAEWESARSAARSQVDSSGHPATERISVVAQTTHGEPFLIAPLDGERLLRREQRYALVSFLASVLFVSLTLWAMHRALAPPLGALISSG